ncbi:hypothetical protein [Streptomyces diastatochromogenes]|uniref:Polysaccharide chain length determinant N-terminal domain-containing protein n=1 Tax=Streptomyces diastatochromogenes TaxID=42236 RepID=A0A233S1J7_STRDA|nr:hypothetical protein [Streptomyces diastatochromogenes]OXY89537.1 hypothetical protein BEK98_37955 [Streptomyces diastatochromogenes]
MTGPFHLDDRYDEPDQLRDQLRRLLRHRAMIALGIVLGLLAGAALALVRTHTYTSTSEVLVRSTTDPFGTVAVAADNQVSMGTEQQIAASAAVAIRAAHTLGQSPSRAGALQDRLRVTNPPKSQVLRFEFTADSPKRAARGANAFAEAYLADRKGRNDAAVERATRGVEQQIAAVTKQSVKKKSDDGDSADSADSVNSAVQSEIATLHKRVSDINSRDTTGGDIVRSGEAPRHPSGPGWPILLVLGLASGLALGILLAWLRSALDSRVRSADEARAALRAPVFGMLPRQDHDGEALLTVGHTGGDRTEAYRALAYRLRQTGPSAGAGRVLVVAPRRRTATGEVAVNLAAALAECGDEVLLVDADPDTPGLATRLPLVPEDARTPEEKSLPEGSLPVDAGTAGRFACCSSAGTGAYVQAGVSGAVHRVLSGADSDTTVVVTRPLLEHADALAVAQRVDGVLLVTDLDTTRRDDLRRVHELIGCSGGNLLGTVLDAGRPYGRLRAALRRRTQRRPTVEPAIPIVEQSAKDDTLTVSRG